MSNAWWLDVGSCACGSLMCRWCHGTAQRFPSPYEHDVTAPSLADRFKSADGQPPKGAERRAPIGTWSEQLTGGEP